MSDRAFVQLWTRDGAYFTVAADDEPRIDAGVMLLLASGGTRDSLLDLTLLNGGPLRVLASEVTSWVMSTPETREAQRAWEAELDEEEEADKRARGWTEDDL